MQWLGEFLAHSSKIEVFSINIKAIFFFLIANNEGRRRGE